MKTAEIKAVLEQTGLSVVYSHYKSGMPLPCIAFREGATEYLFSDDIAYASLQNWVAELYTRNKDEMQEERLGNILKKEGMPFSKTQDFLNSEACYMTTFAFAEADYEPVD